MQNMRKSSLAVVLLAALVPGSGIANADLDTDIGVSDTETRIGNIMPYTGPLAAFATIGKAEAAYFDMINENGGINGRKVKFISYDDNSKPVKALEQTQRLVETDKVLLIFGSFGTPSNLAAGVYLNDKKIPQLFVASGDRELGNPKEFRWTMGWQPTFRIEGRIYANYIQAIYSDRKIAVLWQDDQFGRDLLEGPQEGLGDQARMIVAATTFDTSNPSSLDAQIDVLKRSGADIVLLDVAPPFAALAMRKIAELGWYPVKFLDNTSSSVNYSEVSDRQ
jgi:branched-chain amino acid transport system substrate-binding protein